MSSVDLFCLIYIDDLIIMANEFQELAARMRVIFARLQKAKIQLNPKKCFFGMTKLDYLGHVIENGECRPDPKQVEAALNMAQPKDVTQVQSFLGFLNYWRNYIENFADIAKPMYDLTKKGVPFVWSDACDQAFRRLKECLVGSKILAIFDPDQHHTLACDASDVAIGGCLRQKHPITGVEKIVAFYSRVLNRAERNYCVTEREALAIICAIRFFWCYLEMREFEILTDHCALKYLQKVKNANGRLMRWALDLQGVKATIRHISGKTNCDADCLSRLVNDFVDLKVKDTLDDVLPKELANQLKVEHLNEREERMRTVQKRKVKQTSKLAQVTIVESDSKVEVKAEQGKDVFCKHLLEISEKEQDQKLPPSFAVVNGLVYHIACQREAEGEPTDGDPKVLSTSEVVGKTDFEHLQLVVPHKLRALLLDAYHKHDGHPGYQALYDVLSTKYWWPNMVKDCQLKVQLCKLCAEAKLLKRSKAPHVSLIHQLEASVERPFSHLSLDIVVISTPSSSRRKYILTCIDIFSRYAITRATKNMRASTVVEFLEERVFLVFDLPKAILTDQGTQFKSELFKEVLQILNVRQKMTSGYRPTCNSHVERAQGTLKAMLKTYTHLFPKLWDKHLPYATHAYNSHVHSSTGFSPSFLVFGFQPRHEVDSLFGWPELQKLHRQYQDELPTECAESARRARQLAWSRMRQTVSKSLARINKNRRSRVFFPSEKVLIVKPVQDPGTTTFTTQLYSGEFVVIKRIYDNNYIVRKKEWPVGKTWLVHSDRMRRSSNEYTNVQSSSETAGQRLLESTSEVPIQHEEETISRTTSESKKKMKTSPVKKYVNRRMSTRRSRVVTTPGVREHRKSRLPSRMRDFVIYGTKKKK